MLFTRGNLRRVTEQSGRLGIPRGCMSQETCRFVGTEPKGSDHEGLIVLFSDSPPAEGLVAMLSFRSERRHFLCDSYPLLRKECMKMKRKIAVIMSIAMLAATFTGCGGSSSSVADTQVSSAAETTAETTTGTSEAVTTTTTSAESSAEGSGTEENDDEENYDTGDASLDNIRNQDEIGDNELLVLSFGTSYNDSRDATIGAIETAIQDANPDKEVRRAFTSQIIIDKLKDRDGLEIDNVDEAFERLEADGVKELIVQPTHVMSGFEYDDLMEVVKAQADKFDSVKVGSPLLTSDEDYTNVINAITAATSEYIDGEYKDLIFFAMLDWEYREAKTC